MRYRRLSYRYSSIVTHRAEPWTLAPRWRGHVLGFVFGHPFWRPDADVCETGRTIEVVVDLAGVEDDAVDVRLFDDALVIEGQRRLPPCQDDSVYHTAEVRQGPFRLELPLVAPVKADAVEARYERGLLRITLHKQEGARR
jgi:HSP20 family protein